MMGDASVPTQIFQREKIQNILNVDTRMLFSFEKRMVSPGTLVTDRRCENPITTGLRPPHYHTRLPRRIHKKDRTTLQNVKIRHYHCITP